MALNIEELKNDAHKLADEALQIAEKEDPQVQAVTKALAGVAHAVLAQVEQGAQQVASATAPAPAQQAPEQAQPAAQSQPVGQPGQPVGGAPSPQAGPAPAVPQQ